MAIIQYSDVCRDNETNENFLRTFGYSERAENIDLSRCRCGYFDFDYKGVAVSVTIDRHRSHAGNQYIRLRFHGCEEIKIPLNIDIEISQYKKKIEKMYSVYVEKKNAINKAQKRREIAITLLKSSPLHHTHSLDINGTNEICHRVNSRYEVGWVHIDEFPGNIEQLYTAVQERRKQWHEADEECKRLNLELMKLCEKIV